MSSEPVRAVDVWMEGRKTREYVGRLEKSGEPGERREYMFTYSDAYLKRSDAVSLGPELPLTKRMFQARELFPSLADRIPSRENPAYPEYCAATGIDVEERDPFVLLTSIGKRGPSCFVLEPAPGDDFGAVDAAAFRRRLGVSLREFALLFDVSPFTIHKIETGKQSGRDVLKRLELYARFPEAAWFEMNRNRPAIHTALWERMAAIYRDGRPEDTAHA